MSLRVTSLDPRLTRAIPGGEQMSVTTEHDVTITEKESIAVEDGRLVYRARCSCGWIGWAVFDRNNAWRQRDQHLNRAALA